MWGWSNFQFNILQRKYFILKKETGNMIFAKNYDLKKKVNNCHVVCFNCMEYPDMTGILLELGCCVIP